MSKWGVVHNDDERKTHIVPCDDNGFVLDPHEASVDCKCGHCVKEGMIVHKDPARGGFDS